MKSQTKIKVHRQPCQVHGKQNASQPNQLNQTGCNIARVMPNLIKNSMLHRLLNCVWWNCMSYRIKWLCIHFATQSNNTKITRLAILLSSFSSTTTSGWNIFIKRFNICSLQCLQKRKELSARFYSEVEKVFSGVIKKAILSRMWRGWSLRLLL